MKSNSLISIMAWLVIGLITASAFYLNYNLNVSVAIKAVIWLGWFILSLTLIYFTTQGKVLFEFANDAKIELLKVVWPTRQETIQTTLIVMAMVVITGFVLWIIDSGMMWVIGKITHLG